MATTGANTKKFRTAKAAAITKSKAGALDAIDLLEGDHLTVENLFAAYEAATTNARKLKIAEKICLELKVHTQIEEEILYPNAREATEDDDKIDEAIVEHQAAKDLIAEIEQMEPGDDLYDAKVKVLAEQIEHHVEEEEDELFPEIRKTGLDLRAIGKRLAARKQELLSEFQAKA